MHQSPRIRRLHSDLAALERLRAESSVFRFTATGDPPQLYRITFSGKGLWRDDHGRVKAHEQHHVVITLGASYPRSIPEIRWSSKIFHPNISEIGMVCLGGYGSHWVPGVQLEDLCVMLWDMVRYHNYDIRSPYNRESALWVAGQTEYQFPTDKRPLRDLRAMKGRDGARGEQPAKISAPNGSTRSKPAKSTPASLVLQFLERYGRAGGGPPSGDSNRQNFMEVMARMYPEGPRVVQPTAGPTDLPPKVDAPAPAPARDKVSENGDSSADRDTPATHSTADEHAGFNGDRNDMMIIEASPDDLPRSAPRADDDADDDEVMFIG